MVGHDSHVQFTEIWVTAITQYKRDTKHDILQGRLEADSPDALLDIINSEQHKFKEYRKRGQKIRAALKPILQLTELLSETVGESLAPVSIITTVPVETALTDDYDAYCQVHPPAKAISVAVCILLKVRDLVLICGLVRLICGSQAAKNVSTHYDTIVDMFEELRGFVDRLGVLNQQNITVPLKKVVVEILAQFLSTLGVTMKLMRQRHPGENEEIIASLLILGNEYRLAQYVKALLGRNTDASEAMRKLTRLLNQASLMVNTVTSVNATRGLQILEASRGRRFVFSCSTWLMFHAR